MATTVSSLDIVSSPLLAIVHLSTGKTLKFPKVKPTGSSDASDANWQTRMQTEAINAHDAVMATGSKNATPHLTSLV